FVVVFVCWAVASPFLFVAEANGPPKQIFSICSDTAYQLYGSSDSSLLDMKRYEREADACLKKLMGSLIDVPTTLGAMIGLGDHTIGLVMWGLLLVPPAILWLLCWVIGRTVLWIVAGFRQTS